MRIAKKAMAFEKTDVPLQFDRIFTHAETKGRNSWDRHAVQHSSR